MKIKTPEYIKVMSRLSAEDAEPLAHVIQSGYFASHYSIIQSLIITYNIYAMEDPVCPELEQLFKSLDFNEAPYSGRRGKGSSKYFKLVARLNPQECCIISEHMKKVGCKSYNKFIQTLMIGYSRMVKSMIDNPQPRKTVNYIDKEFRENANYQTIDYIKPKRRMPVNSVYDM